MLLILHIAIKLSKWKIKANVSNTIDTKHRCQQQGNNGNDLIYLNQQRRYRSWHQTLGEFTSNLLLWNKRGQKSHLFFVEATQASSRARREAEFIGGLKEFAEGVTGLGFGVCVLTYTLIHTHFPTVKMRSFYHKKTNGLRTIINAEVKQSNLPI